MCKRCLRRLLAFVEFRVGFPSSDNGPEFAAGSGSSVEFEASGIWTALYRPWAAPGRTASRSRSTVGCGTSFWSVSHLMICDKLRRAGNLWRVEYNTQRPFELDTGEQPAGAPTAITRKPSRRRIAHRAGANVRRARLSQPKPEPVTVVVVSRHHQLRKQGRPPSQRSRPSLVSVQLFSPAAKRRHSSRETKEPAASLDRSTPPFAMWQKV